MAARAGMTTLIQKVRSYTNAGTADYTLAGTAYWSDDQLEDTLDSHRRKVLKVSLDPEQNFVNSDYQTTIYHLPEWANNLEQFASDSEFRLYDSTGTNIGTADYSVNYEARAITFTTDQDSAVRYADFHIYDVFRAASEVWKQKAAHVAANVNWQSDNHRIDAAQEYEHCLKMATQYAGMAGPTFTRMVRVDEA